MWRSGSGCSLGAVAWLALAAGICLLYGCASPIEHIHHDDGWRRTASGWERTLDWHSVRLASFIRPSADSPPGVRVAGSRMDTHPAALALLELLGAMLALFAIPSQRVQLLSALASLPAAIARSFRASAFG
jgi:hypothetical protein